MNLVSPERSEAGAISFWDEKGRADAYDDEQYPEILNVVSKTAEGTSLGRDL